MFEPDYPGAESSAQQLMFKLLLILPLWSSLVKCGYHFALLVDLGR